MMDGSKSLEQHATLTLDADQFRRALAFASSAAHRRNTIPVLGRVLAKVADGTITLSGTDLDVEATQSLACDGDAAAFDFTLDPHLVLGLLKDQSGPFTMDMAGDVLSLDAGGMTAKFRYLIPAADFPPLPLETTRRATEANPDPQQDPLLIGSFSAQLPRKALLAVLPSSSTKETRYYLNGAYLHRQDGEGLRAVSTDGHKLSKYCTHADWPFEPAILPTKTVRILCAMLAAAGDTAVEIAQMGLRMRFTLDADARCIVTKVIDGTFPDYTRVTPSADRPVDISVSLSGAALRRFPALGRAPALKLAGDLGTMSISDFDDTDFTQTLVGRGAPFGLNLNYLKAFIGPKDVARIDGHGANDPFLVLNDDPNLTRIIMPMAV